LRQLNEQLHAMSQPMTVLLCTLEYSASLDSVPELIETVKVSQEACERLRKSVAAMQTVVREAIENSSGMELSSALGERSD